MAEQSKKSYLSAREFIDSWEKEIYELTYLDFFTFLLINELASELEKKYFSGVRQDDFLFLNNDEIGLLAFNIGDSIQLFFEKNCFGSCQLNCPIQLNKTISSHDLLQREGLILSEKFHHSCQRKEDCLYTELLNYVVLDSLLDFYNYELGVVMDEKDHDIIVLVEFIMKVIMNFIRTRGQKWLATPDETAGEQFDRYLQNEEYSWDGGFGDLPEDDVEGDEWKVNQLGPAEVMEDFRQAYAHDYRNVSEFRVVEKFSDFMKNYLELENIRELNSEDIQEFFLVVLVNEYLVVDNFALENVVEIFEQMVEFIAYNYEHSLIKDFTHFRKNVVPEIERTFTVSREYQNTHPLVEYLISKESSDSSLIEGFFEVKGKTDGLLTLADIHLNTVFKQVRPDRLNHTRIKKGDIIHGQVILKNNQWHLVHLEMLYSKYARPHLF